MTHSTKNLSIGIFERIEMAEFIIIRFLPWPHHVEANDIFQSLLDELPRFGLAQMIEILIGRHTRLLAAVLRYRIRNLD
jgi:hypothetical protein